MEKEIAPANPTPQAIQIRVWLLVLLIKETRRVQIQPHLQQLKQILGKAHQPLSHQVRANQHQATQKLVHQEKEIK